MMEQILKKIIQTELTFPIAFAQFEKREWGILFYDESNKNSHDSNHAVIFPDKMMCLPSVLKEIKDFYLEKAIAPRIYHPLVNGYLEENREAFLEQDYSFEIFNQCRYMTLTGENRITSEKRLNIVLLRYWDERIALELLIPNQSDYEIEVVKKALRNKNYYLFVGFLDDKAVTIASLYYSDYKCARLDLVQTAISYRNKGFMQELISYVVGYHTNNSDVTLYLWVENPIAQKTYEKAGFTLLSHQFESWVAVFDNIKG